MRYLVHSKIKFSPDFSGQDQPILKHIAQRLYVTCIFKKNDIRIGMDSNFLTFLPSLGTNASMTELTTFLWAKKKEIRGRNAL